jgi:hypothetical protein
MFSCEYCHRVFLKQEDQKKCITEHEKEIAEKARLERIGNHPAQTKLSFHGVRLE